MENRSGLAGRWDVGMAKKANTGGSFDREAVSYLDGCGGYTTLPMDISWHRTIQHVYVPMSISWF